MRGNNMSSKQNCFLGDCKAICEEDIGGKKKMGNLTS